MEEMLDKQNKQLEDIINSDNITAEQREFLIYHKGTFKEIIENSLTDQLTSLYNRRKFELDIAKEVNRADHEKNDVSLVIYDIDNFKKIQDSHENGHLYGDWILKSVGDISKRSVNNFDGVYRLGGDEFALLLPNTHLTDGATDSIKRIRHRLKNDVGITISAGIANYKENARNTQELHMLADKAMYRSKIKKDTITIFGQGEV